MVLIKSSIHFFFKLWQSNNSQKIISGVLSKLQNLSWNWLFRTLALWNKIMKKFTRILTKSVSLKVWNFLKKATKIFLYILLEWNLVSVREILVHISQFSLSHLRRTELICQGAMKCVLPVHEFAEGARSPRAAVGGKSARHESRAALPGSASSSRHCLQAGRQFYALHLQHAAVFHSDWHQGRVLLFEQDQRQFHGGCDTFLIAPCNLPRRFQKNLFCRRCWSWCAPTSTRTRSVFCRRAPSTRLWWTHSRSMV